MADRLLVHYRPCDGDQISWCLVGDNGRPSGPVSHGHLSDLTEEARGRRATVLIDAACTSIETVNIPSNNRQRQLQAAPFALEDNLATDIEELYFALGKKQADDNIPVITIDRALFRHTLDRFKQAAIFVEVMAADVLALPINNDHWTVLVYENNALIRTSATQGYFCDRTLLADFLTALMEEQETVPPAVELYHQQDDGDAAQLLRNEELTVNVAGYTAHPLEVFAGQFADARALNLLQGKFSPRRESSALLQPWKAVAAVAVVWLALELIYAGFEIRQLQNKNLQLTADIEQVYKQVNPGARKFSNMKIIMERKLNALRGGGGDSGEIFIDLLADAAAAFAEKNITIHGMAYSNKHVDMELQAATSQDLEQVKNQLGSAGNIKVTLSTSIEKDKVKGRLRLEKQS